MPINEKTFCIGPWSECRIMPNGSLNYCHRAELKSPGDSGYLDNISSVDLDSYFHGESINHVRNLLLQGDNAKWCQPCYNDEKKIEFSYRRRRNIQMAIFPNKDFKKSLEESAFFDRIQSADYKPFFYNISTSNLCNLGCVMCNEGWSSRLASEFRRIGIQMKKTPAADSDSILLDWSHDDAVWEKFMRHILNNDQIVCVHFQGGEPLLQKRVLEFIDRCVQENHVNFHFTTVTNGTVYDADLVDKLKKFKSVQIEISVENLKKSNDYVRYPSKNTEVLENIKNFLQHRDEKFDVVVRTVPQLLTVLDYDSLMEKCLELGVVIDSNILHHPNFFCVSVLPDHLKKLARQRLLDFVEKNQTDQILYNSLNVRNRGFVRQSLVDNARMIIAGLDQPHTGDHDFLIGKCRDYLRQIDGSRNINLGDYCPEIADWLYGG